MGRKFITKKIIVKNILNDSDCLSRIIRLIGLNKIKNVALRILF